MLDDHGLRLLAEIGIDVYLPRRAATAPAAQVDAAPASAPAAAAAPGVAFVCAREGRGNLRGHVLLALRAAGLRIVEGDAAELAAGGDVAGVVVLGEALARSLGAGLPAQRHAGLEWVIAGEPAALARGVAPKRALWGEIKRLARILAARG